MECVYKAEENMGHIHLKHLDYSSFTALGIIKPSTWIKYAELARKWILHKMLGEFSESTSFIMKRISLRYKTEMLTLNMNDRNMSDILSSFGSDNMIFKFLRLPFQITYSLLSVKGSIFVGEVVILNLKTNREVASAIIEDQLVGTNTGKILNFADVKGFVGLLPSKISTMPHTDLAEPNFCCNFQLQEQVFHTSYQITCMDIEQKDHCSPALFVNMCFNCIEEAIHGGFTMDFSVSICHYTAKDIWANFINYGCIDDLVNISMCIDSHNSKTLHFNLKINEAVSCYLTISFYDHNQQSRLPKL